MNDYKIVKIDCKLRQIYSSIKALFQVYAIKSNF